MRPGSAGASRTAPRAPIGRLSPDEVPEPFREQIRGAQDELEALRLGHVPLEDPWLDEGPSFRCGNLEQNGFHVLTLMSDAPAPARTTPESAPPEAHAPRVLRPRALVDHEPGLDGVRAAANRDDKRAERFASVGLKLDRWPRHPGGSRGAFVLRFAAARTPYRARTVEQQP